MTRVSIPSEAAQHGLRNFGPADQGLEAELRAQASKASVPVLIESVGIGRYSRDAEAAVYFCVLEALQNVAKYAGAPDETTWPSHNRYLLNVRAAVDHIRDEKPGRAVITTGDHPQPARRPAGGECLQRPKQLGDLRHADVIEHPRRRPVDLLNDGRLRHPGKTDTHQPSIAADGHAIGSCADRPNRCCTKSQQMTPTAAPNEPSGRARRRGRSVAERAGVRRLLTADVSACEPLLHSRERTVGGT